MKENWDSEKSLQVFQLLRFGMLVLIGILLTHSKLSVSEIGQYESFLFWAGMASFFWLNGLIQGALPMAGSEEKEAVGRQKSPFLFTVFFVLLVFSTFTALMFTVLYQAGLLSFLRGHALYWFLLFVVFGIPANLTVYIYLLDNRPGGMLRYGFGIFGLQLMLILIALVSGEGIEIILKILALVALLQFSWLVRLVLRYSSVIFSRELARKLLIRSWPLILATLLSGSAQYIDGWLVTLRFGSATFAIFRFGARELPLVVLIANAFSNAMLPKLGKPAGLSLHLDEIKVRSAKMMNWMFPLSALLMILSPWIFPLIFNPAFAESASIFNIYLLLIIPRLVFPQTILNGIGKTTIISRAAVYEILINVGLSILLSFPFGLEGVALATVIAYLFEKCYLAYWLYRLEGITVTAYNDWKRHLLFSAGILTLFLMIEIVIN
ncbi:polysaccharide biosynthesis C-terminal domain-containing protein [Prolixibacter sp. SD074]|uniref:polysaccharide biosynthesis C-terminal domain-containing protein n=1 Tax=Prolixibacter sp. SD074 TaxID=2652391 RepID=UPI00129913A2|nr:polysaccharide biosynthesis C-terminal domain-containing protein [Prolixibacter sp. SD074]